MFTAKCNYLSLINNNLPLIKICTVNEISLTSDKTIKSHLVESRGGKTEWALIYKIT